MSLLAVGALVVTLLVARQRHERRPNGDSEDSGPTVQRLDAIRSAGL